MFSLPRAPVGVLVTARAAYHGSHGFLRLQLEGSDTWALAHVESGWVLVDILRRMGTDVQRSEEDTRMPLSRWVRTLDICFRQADLVNYQLEPWTKLWSSWPHVLWYLILSTSGDLSTDANKAYGILFEAFLHFGAKADATFSISPEQSGSVRVTATGVPEDDESILHSATQPAAQLAASKGGVVSLRDLVALRFPRHGERLQALIDNNIAGNADTSGYWEALMGMSDVELSKEMDGIVGLFSKYLHVIGRMTEMDVVTFGHEHIVDRSLVFPAPAGVYSVYGRMHEGEARRRPRPRLSPQASTPYHGLVNCTSFREKPCLLAKQTEMTGQLEHAPAAEVVSWMQQYLAGCEQNPRPLWHWGDHQPMTLL